MATTNLGLPLIASNNTADVVRDMNALANAVDTNAAKASDGIRYAATTNAANAYSATLSPTPTAYVDGMAVAVKINVDSTGASTLNLNALGAKPLKKANGNDVTNLKANGVYTFRYNTTTGNFILQGEGGSGTAQAGDILSGKTASTDSGDVTGTMANNGAVTITPGSSAQTIPAGYHTGSGIVQGDPDLVSGNIKAGVNIFGVVGATNVVDTTTGTGASSGNILTGKTAFVNGSTVSGTMPNKVGSATVITPNTADQAIPQGYFGGAVGDGKVKGDANLIAANILSGKSIFGIAGSVVTGTPLASGTQTGTSGDFTVSGLNFTPRMVIVMHNDGTNFYVAILGNPYNILGAPQTDIIQINDTSGTGAVDRGSATYSFNSGGFHVNNSWLGTSINWLAIA